MASRNPPEDALTRYREKRNFTRTPEPEGAVEPAAGALRFVIHKHWATRLHYDLRLECEGTMKSWAVPKGPSLDPREKRMAVQVEDHPISYNSFEGQIPPGQYGAGRVVLWERGHWIPHSDPVAGLRDGHLKFALQGEKLHGSWALVRMGGKRFDPKKPAWLLIKERDAEARPADEYDVTEALPDSVNTGAAAKAQPAPKAAKQAPSQPERKSTAKKSTQSAALGSPLKALPQTLAPQLATLANAPPSDGVGWIYELKFDGYRMLARIDARGAVRLFTRSGNDWTDKLAPIADAIKALGLRSTWLDGELTATGDNGAPDFQRLQNAFDRAATTGLIYTLFDLPVYAGRDLREEPLLERRAALEALLQKDAGEILRFSAAFDARASDLVASACKIGFEGVIGKRADAPYRSGRSSQWIKLKCSQRQEFVVGGFTEPQGGRSGLGALLLGVHDGKGALLYAGKVGTGFTDDALQRLRAQLEPLVQKRCPFSAQPADARKAHWLKPTLVAEVAFAEWTQDGHIRHSVFKGLRTDKPAHSIVREQATRPAATTAAQPKGKRPAGAKAPSPALPSSFSITHGERVIDAASGTTKRDLARYYATVAPLMLEHLAGRPVALVRAPQGVGKETFFQKHGDAERLPGIEALDPQLDPGHGPLLEVVSAVGLLSAAQMNVIEFHTWNARADRIERPDRITFDLDPGEGVAWPQIQEAAELVRVLLRELGLPAFLKTSGGKGLHVVVPLKRLRDWDSTKDFSQAVVQHLARAIPRRFVGKSGPRNRVGKIFVDYLRNGRGATTVSAWSARARPGLGVSVPVAWSELPSITSGAHWTVATIEDRLRLGNGPWAGYDKAASALGEAMARLDFTPSA
ncbi:MAG: DNA ligase D [Simplicispira suum]|uniref:DNA ligase D n=1 Tax=Simplicispira suum TaxID=2109915 RepID=UPI001C6BE877|nr:DNA ligase D [Simplicispira suum]MBW7834595.1 DNA ligase D [Simplicispira suum]